MLSAYIKKYFLFFTLAFVYFFLRLSYVDTIEFGYDQPRISLTIMDVIENKDFLNVVKYINSSNITEDTITWGPFLVYFLTPFFLLTRNPIVISQALVVFNFLGIIFTYLIGKKLFNQRVGYFAAFFMAVFPWSVVFSRMIYNPGLLLTFPSLILYLTVLITKDKRNKLLFLLPPLWSLTIQFHFLSISIVFISLFYLFVNFKRTYWKSFIGGAILSLIFWLPLMHYEWHNDFRISKGFLRAPTYLLSNLDKIKRYEEKPIVAIGNNFLKTLIGDNFKYQLGYGYQDFIKSLPSTFFIYKNVFSLILLISSFFVLLHLLVYKKKNDFLILIWLLSVPIFIFILHLPEVPPRYFLAILPAEGLIIARFVDKGLAEFLKKKVYSNIFFYFTILIIASINIFFMIRYYNFILKYSYPEKGWFGWLSRSSDPPYSFAYQSFVYALNDAQKLGFNNITFSNDQNIIDKYAYNSAQEYIWQYVLRKKFDVVSNSPHYFIILGPPPEDIPESIITRIGCYSVYRKVNKAQQLNKSFLKP